jgi:hypothetical protein
VLVHLLFRGQVSKDAFAFRVSIAKQLEAAYLLVRMSFVASELGALIVF